MSSENETSVKALEMRTDFSSRIRWIRNDKELATLTKNRLDNNITHWR